MVNPCGGWMRLTSPILCPINFLYSSLLLFYVAVVVMVVVCKPRHAMSGLRDQKSPAKSTSLAEVKENRCSVRE